jgi:SNF2 family DNA or RNA helicase
MIGKIYKTFNCFKTTMSLEVETSWLQRYNWFLGKSRIDHKQHQQDGIMWCVENETRTEPLYGVRGGFIADEMGLGKTILMIGTFIVHFMPNTLIVVPTMLMNQWAKEIFRTTGHNALIYYGSKHKKGITLEQLKLAPIVITTYNTLVPTKQMPKCMLLDMDWSRVVFDEAHHLRNKNIRSASCRALKTGVSWLVSGTPIQNKKSDFYNLCAMLGLPASVYTDIDERLNIMRHFILRRTKAEAGIILPSVTQDKAIIAWATYNERKLSEDIHSALHSASYKLPLFTQARKACILPELLLDSYPSMIQSRTITNNFIYTDALKYSSKMDHVISVIMERADNGSGKLVFCHFRDEIDVIIRRLKERGMSNVVAFDGRDTKRSRAMKLSQKYDALILQIQTGCEGLNLQEHYSEIYFISPHWNPAVEDQAVARCHRIGQIKPVFVFRFQMCDFLKEQQLEQIENEDVEMNDLSSMDEYITSVQERKRELVLDILPS